ncbi:MAG TPA: glycoside hydrolase family 3 N-terminal domain-containing protein, partial [Tepidisphaeraceae bacterium]|nr:glycoside hydrolase family 3 N-terminal domain-containing protein [Tepidisphaeraceae bacterium]
MENVAAVNEYHWMAGNFLKYAGPLKPEDLPVDSHELIALCAPRPVFISAGAVNGDGWADAKGTFLAGVAATPVYELLGKKGLPTSEFPPIETALTDGDIAFRQHSGGHTPGPNWPTFIDFASRYFNPSAAVSASSAPSTKYKDTSLSPEERAADLVSQMTLEEKAAQMQNAAPAIPRLGIPAYDWWNEALHGVARAGLATVFPQAIGLAATWDTDLESRVAHAISTEARAKYNDAQKHDNHGRYYGLTFWSPNINIFRDPRWGRGQETYGEDPYLTSRMGIAFIKAMQGSDPHYFKTVATSKHYAVHSGPETTRHHFDAEVSEEDLDNTYLYAFRATVTEGGADSVMCAYNRVNGSPACASDLLLKDKLRSAWNFKGYVVSDCDSIDDIYRGHHTAASAAEASALAVKAGTDLDCGRTYRTLPDAVRSGLISEKQIDESVQRLFVARIRLGMFDPPERVPFSKIPMTEVQSAAHQKLSLEAAEKSITLLKNEGGLLPFRKIPKRIAVVGPAADDPDALLANYNGIPAHIITPLQAIEQQFGKKAAIRFALGATYVDSASALVPQNVLTPKGEGKAHGLTAEYFADDNLSGTPR